GASGRRAKRRGLAARLLGTGAGRPAPRGVYLYGDVGRGKSMLMDLFHRSAPAAGKRRVHFHAFMAEVHDRLHRARLAARRDPKRSAGDLLLGLAETIVGETPLLCFDELEVTSIADAMILGRLFTALLDSGVVLVATSNDAPDDLYRDGLQRELFLPFVALLKERLDVLHLDGDTDYRGTMLKARGVYHLIEGDGAKAETILGGEFASLAYGLDVEPVSVKVQGRSLEVPRAAGPIAWFDFDSLCARPLGAADYLALADRFDVVLISAIPVMGPELRNEARRFMHLIDVLYERRVKLVCSAEAPPGALYVAGQGAMAFRRTASRLVEMQGEDYLRAAHRRLEAKRTGR
ncbi:MAG: cell division protein ZapE, partial [Alphaproteobacteria bacterium]